MSDSEMEMSDRNGKDLFSESSKKSSSDLGSYIEATVKDSEEIGYVQGFIQMCKYALPSSGGMILRRVIDIMNFVVIGRLGDPTLVSGAGLGITTICVTTTSLGVGLAGGVETLSSQAFGSGNNYLAGRYYTRAQVVLTILFVPQAILLYFITPILISVGQPVRSAEIAGLFIKILIPGVWGYCQTELLRKFLGTQGAFYIVTNSQIFNLLLHPIWLYIFVSAFSLSVSGVAIATSITYFMNYLVPVIYVTFKKDSVRENSMHWINKDSFVGLWQYMKYAIPAMMLTALEYCAFEATTIIGGTIGESELAACVILFNVVAFVYMVPLGFCYAANTLVGNNLGAMNVKNVNIYRDLATYIAVGFSLVLGASMFVFRYQIANLFTQDQGIIDIVVAGMPLASLSTFGDYTQGITQGTIKAMGIQSYATVFALTGFWVIAIPLTALFTFKFHWGIYGAWGGLPIGLAFVGISYIFLVYRTDTTALAQKVSERIMKEAEGRGGNRFNTSKSVYSDSFLQD
ncbi:unnamed protein product [Moneuplotes crassus]|uniref:Uncharacterized protein n=1 Tax=Euplotes crassus TaxID=5936 RepID=A0AAD1X967_EUPCR|nr:unnamed protein product [Moneuplotes crassus]